MLNFEHSLVWCENLDTSENRSEIPGKFWNVVMEENGEVSVGQILWKMKKRSQGGDEYLTNKKKKEG